MQGTKIDDSSSSRTHSQYTKDKGGAAILRRKSKRLPPAVRSQTALTLAMAGWIDAAESTLAGKSKKGAPGGQ